VKPDFSLVSYFESLPSEYIISSLPNSPRMTDISHQQRDELLYRCENIQAALDSINPIYENIEVNEHALKNEIFSLLANDDILSCGDVSNEQHQAQKVKKTGFFANTDQRDIFKEQAKGVVSRSQWYVTWSSKFTQPS